MVGTRIKFERRYILKGAKDMLYMLDTADLQEIKRAFEIYPLSGVTTNPTIISQTGEDVFRHLNKIREIIGLDTMLHIQVTGKTKEDMLREAKMIKERVLGNIYIKVPANQDGIAAMKKMKGEGYNITATAVYTLNQALLAAAAGADFVAPYVNRMELAGMDSKKILTEMVTGLKGYGYKTKILAASFKKVEQVYNVALTLADSITVKGDILDLILQHELTDRAVEKFHDHWIDVYGDRLLTDM